jgi:DNA-binding MarR family transcriptional regulator
MRDTSPEFPLHPDSPFALLAPVERAAWFSYMRLQLRLRYELNRQLQTDSGVSLADFDVLVALTSDPDSVMGVSALAARIGWERSRLSHHLKRMSDRRLVVVAVAASDRRVREVRLAPEGAQVLRAATPAHIDLVRAMFTSALDADGLAVLTDALDRVYESVIAQGTLPRPVDHP